MNWKTNRAGQAQHFFSDAIPGILIIFFGLVVFSYFSPSQQNYEERLVTTPLNENYGERQLYQFLETRIAVGDEYKEAWEILAEAPQKNTVKGPSELTGIGFYSYGILHGESLVAQDYAYRVFDSLFTKGFWYLILHYHDLPYDVEIVYNPDFLDRCARSGGRDYSASAHVPGEHAMDVTLHYCIMDVRS